MTGTATLIATLQVLIVVIGVGGMWWLVNLLTEFDDHAELWVANNWGYLAQRAGFVLAQIVGVSGLLGRNLDDWSSLAWVAGGLVWSTLLAAAGFWITDWMILRTRATRFADLNRVPLPVGLVRLGFYVGLGLIVRATLIGEAPNLRIALLSTLVFTAAGIAGLVLAYYLHGFVSRAQSGGTVVGGALTGALESMGVLAAVGIILHGAIAGDFTTWGDSLAGFGAALGIAYVGLYVARYLVDWFILTGRCTLRTIHEQQQTGAAALLAFLLVMVAIPVSAVVSLYVA